MCSTMEVGIFVRFKLHTFEPRCAKAVVMLSSGPCEAYKAAYIIGMISVLANFPGGRPCMVSPVKGDSTWQPW